MTEKRSDTSESGETQSPCCSCRIRFGLIAVVILACIAAAIFYLEPWNALQYGTADPPRVDAASIERPLAATIAKFTVAVNEDPYSAEAWGNLGSVLDVHGFIGEAIVCYQRAQVLDPSDFRWFYSCGVQLLLTDQAAALEQFQQAVRLRDDYAPLHIYLGRGLLQLEQVEDAETHFLKARELDPQLLRAHLGLGKCDLARGDARQALEHLEAALQINPDQGEVHRAAAEAQRRLGDMDEAQRHLDLATDSGLMAPLRDPIRSELSYTFGATTDLRRKRTDQLVSQGRIDEAIEEWNEALRDDPQSDDAQTQLGFLYNRMDKPDEALSHFRKAVKINSANASAQASIGNIYVQQDKPAEAIVAFELAVKADPELFKARNTLGVLLVSQGQVERGLVELRASCREDEDDPTLLTNLALGLKRANQFEEAAAVYARLIALNPDDPRIHFERGLALSGAERFDEAAEQFEQVTRLDPSIRSAYSNLAKALQRAGRFTEAVEVLRNGLNVLPGDPNFTRELAWMLATCVSDQVRNGPEAVMLILPLGQETKFRDPRISDVLGAGYAESGDFPSALKYVKLAVLALSRIPPDVTPPFDVTEYKSKLDMRIALYEKNQPFRDDSSQAK